MVVYGIGRVATLSLPAFALLDLFTALGLIWLRR